MGDMEAGHSSGCNSGAMGMPEGGFAGMVFVFPRSVGVVGIRTWGSGHRRMGYGCAHA